MAVPASFAESNLVLDSPPGMTPDECEPLSVLRTRTPSGQAVVISCWKLTAEELAEINRTGRVWLGILGHTMPPAWIDGTVPFQKATEQD
jgi:hypothetical protein